MDIRKMTVKEVLSHLKEIVWDWDDKHLSYGDDIDNVVNQAHQSILDKVSSVEEIAEIAYDEYRTEGDEWGIAKANVFICERWMNIAEKIHSLILEALGGVK